MRKPTFRRPSAKTLKTVLVVGGAFIVGSALGTAAAGGPPEERVVTKEVEVIKEVEVPGETVTETVEVPTVPQECLVALSEADNIFALTGEYIGSTVLLAVESAYYGDVAGMEQASAEMDEFNTALESSQYRTYADQCLTIAHGAS